MKQEFTITAYTENQVGLLNRIAILFSKRKVNIDSLNTSPTEIPDIFRFNIVVLESEETVQKIVRQIEKQVDVLKAYYHDNEGIVWQEMALYKVPTKEIAERVKVERLLRELGARAVLIRHDYLVFEVTGHREETQRVVEFFEPIGLIEFVRSARVAIIKESRSFHERLLEFEKADPGEALHTNEHLDENKTVFSM
ncbi:MAG TPA: acetolactate synthase small subunit [Bacteroidetes bacterium]|nr:acetolactate synthase small subunit [Bacteroidota bacterium]